MSCVRKVYLSSVIVQLVVLLVRTEAQQSNLSDINLVNSALSGVSGEGHDWDNGSHVSADRRYMDYRDVYGLKFDPSLLQLQAGRLDDKIDLPRNESKPQVKKKVNGKKKRKHSKKKMEKVQLMKPPEYQETVSPLTVVVPKGYKLKRPEQLSYNNTIDVSKLERYQKLIASLRKRMKQLQSLTTTNSNGIIAKNTQMPARFLDVFEIVEFEHRPFCATSPPPLSRMTGSCYSLKQCSKLGGLALSSCALGYGICCVFKMTCNGFTEQEVSYFESPGYPAPALGQLSCSMAILLKPRTQQLLLEFEFFELLPPQNGTCVTDKFVVLGQNTNKPIPILCGINSGHHMYIDVFDATERKIFLTVIGSGNEARGFRIKVTQLIERQAPPDCLQYYEGTTGLIKSFNYDDISTVVRQKFGSYFNNLNYAVCIKRSPGYCTIAYTTEETGALARPFQLRNIGENGMLTIPEGQAGAEIFSCPDDYISVNSIRLCGDRLNDASVTDNFTLNAPVVDYSFGPVVLPVRTNGNTVGRGFNLRFTQMPCQRQIISV